jgi:hypothetical protein
MFPSIDLMMEAVLMSFEIDEDVVARVAFMKIWNEPGPSARSIRSTVIRTFSNRRSNFGGIAKTELFRLLCIPVLLSNATLEEIAYRGAKMEELKAGVVCLQISSL